MEEAPAAMHVENGHTEDGGSRTCISTEYPLTSAHVCCCSSLVPTEPQSYLPKMLQEGDP
jgi:hypothetical protein